MAAGSIVVDFPSMGAACCFSSLESLLRDSTSRFLAAVSAAPDPDLTNFRSLFSWVLNTYPDPSLEAVWFFSAFSFHDAPDDLRNLLHLLSQAQRDELKVDLSKVKLKSRKEGL
ncbi:hypothetical protein E2562_027547 [Oryza meyeriana var. granulata]|uniref:Uncharacterized protein n=1 Tax=Oryza meyeriana var. granulata TaxID=110450 RepID=A0A6G1CI56_9ORYZ|nr:hypothetical protein E2562_027547 [Oryza meyeriana var. granulata]